MVIYFSGTGNSSFCAKKIAFSLQDELVNAGEYIKENRIGSFTSQKPWIFVCPTYAWQVPHIFEAFIRKSSFSGAKDAYFIMTCGDDTGNGGAYNKLLCEDMHLNYMGTLEAVMPENYLAMFSVPDEEESSRIIAKSLPVLEKGATAIAAGKAFTDDKATLADKMKSGIVNTAFYALFVNAKKFYVKENCLSCGKCETLCPTNCISLKEGNPVWGEGCTHCMACICCCPAEAIEYGKKSVGQRRYQCPQD